MPAPERALTQAFVCAVVLGFGGAAPAVAGDAVPLGPDTVKPVNVEVAAVEADSLAVIPGLVFADGTIEVEVAGASRANAFEGAIALWIRAGTEGRFANLRVTQ